MSAQLLVVLTVLALLCAAVRGDSTEELNFAINQFESNQECFNTFDKIRMAASGKAYPIAATDDEIETLCHGDCGEIGRRILQHDKRATNSAMSGRTQHRAIIEAACTHYMASDTFSTNSGSCWQFVNTSRYNDFRRSISSYPRNCSSLLSNGECTPSCASVVQAFVYNAKCCSRLVFEVMRSVDYNSQRIYGGAPFSRCNVAVTDGCSLQAVGELSSGAVTGSHHTISLLFAAAVTTLIFY